MDLDTLADEFAGLDSNVSLGSEVELRGLGEEPLQHFRDAGVRAPDPGVELAMLYWYTYVNSPSFRVDVMPFLAGHIPPGTGLGPFTIRADGPPPQVQCIVVAHAGRSMRPPRLSLVVLAPVDRINVYPARMGGHAAATAWDVVMSKSARRVRPDLGGMARAGHPIFEQSGPYAESARRRVAEAFADFGQTDQWRVVIAPRPTIQFTADVAKRPSPAWRTTSGGEPSTAGVMCTDEHGRVGVTLARHAVGARPHAIVGGRQATVVSSDVITDSCFALLDHAPGPCESTLGPLRGSAPGVGSEARFDGAESGPVPTKVIGTDPGLPFDTRPEVQLKLYTKPATVLGDSGAALVDDDGHVLGFSFYRTGLDADVEHAVWIWAESVFVAHGLFA